MQDILSFDSKTGRVPHYAASLHSSVYLLVYFQGRSQICYWIPRQCMDTTVSKRWTGRYLEGTLRAFGENLKSRGFVFQARRLKPVLQLRHLLLRTFLRPTSYLPTASLEQENALTTICFEDYTLTWLSRLAAHISPVVPTAYLDDHGVQILLVSVISHSLVWYTRASIVRFFDLLLGLGGLNSVGITLLPSAQLHIKGREGKTLETLLFKSITTICP